MGLWLGPRWIASVVARAQRGATCCMPERCRFLVASRWITFVGIAQLGCGWRAHGAAGAPPPPGLPHSTTAPHAAEVHWSLLQHPLSFNSFILFPASASSLVPIPGYLLTQHAYCRYLQLLFRLRQIKSVYYSRLCYGFSIDLSNNFLPT